MLSVQSPNDTTQTQADLKEINLFIHFAIEVISLSIIQFSYTMAF